jgi:hypothetical protein
MQLEDGRVVPIRHPELLAIMPPGRSVFVAYPDGGLKIMVLLLVVGQKSRNRSPRRGRRPS